MSSGATSPPSEESSPTAATPAPVLVVALAANNGKIKQPATENNNMVEISIDTSSQFVDIRQQDSGSNQSGSDSGLGYTNSVSSDNSSFIVATSQDQAASKHQSIINSNSGNTSTSNNNNTLSMNNSPSSSSITKQVNKAMELDNATEETRTSSIKLKKQSSELGFKSDHAPQLQFTNDDDHDELGRRHNVTHLNNELVSKVQPCAPIIKSLLKKSSQFNDANHKPTKHNRNVSFNQTVIVFCEETEMPSLVDQFDPPVGYQDSISSFEPPDDYCDHKNERVDENSNDVTDKGSKLAASAKLSRVLNSNNKNSASDLNDDQLFGLLDNGSLLESLKFNCEDFSEDDFPINYLNSNHSYLCEDAISDYDSDSESSLYVEREKRNTILPSVTKSAQLIGNDTHVDIKLTSKGREKSKSPSDGDKNVQLNNNRNYSKDELASTRSTKAAVNQKSMPARMKVSTVDNSHLKRNSNLNRKEDADRKSKLDSSQSVVGNNPKQLQLERKQPGELLDAPSLAPMVIKQSTVEPIPLSKPIIVRNNFNNSEQLPNIDRAPDRESKFETSGTQSLMASKQPSEMKECNIPSETIINQPQKMQQFSQANININHMPPTSQINEPACQICRVIESNRSQTNPEHKAINSHDAQPVKSFSHNNVERETRESQPNQIQFIKTPDDQPVVFNQSCVSCREALMKQQQPTQENTCVRTTAQPVRAVTYQLVYVVDQKGNRVRALSVRPAFNAPVTSVQQASLAGRRILIAQNGQRFQNPISINNQATNNLQKNPVNPSSQWGQNPMSNNNTQQYRLIDTAQAQIAQQAQHNKELRGQQVSYIRAMPPVQKVPLESSGLRQHTVYYVRQPLDNQNIRQSYDATRSNYRSFPDPHEIRRLDGLKGPTATMSLSHRDEHNAGPKVSNDARSETSASRNEFPREDTDDPTFGFSKRPSVKVVATSSSHSSSSNLNTQSYATSNMNVLDSNREHHLNSNNVTTLNRYVANQPVNVRPVSLVVMGSQTLDRRLASSQQGRGMKENIPTTNSMSNIHGTLTGIPPNKVNQQQQRISNVQIVNPNNDKITSKETRINRLGTCTNIVNNHGEIVTNNRVSQMPTSQVCQASSQKYESNNTATTDEQNRKANEQSRVVYSMNI